MATFPCTAAQRARRRDGTDIRCQLSPKQVPLVAAPSRGSLRRRGHEASGQPRRLARVAWRCQHATRPRVGRIVGTNIRKQEQHQQGASLVAHIGTPLHEVRVFVPVTDVDVPAIVTGRILGGEADRKGAKVVARIPSADTDELVE